MTGCRTAPMVALRRALAATAIVASAASLSACGFSDVLDKRDTADRIRDSFDVARRAGVAVGELRLNLTLLKLKTLAPVPGVKEGMSTPEQAVPTVVDVDKGKWAALADLGAGPQPIQAYDGAVLYVYAADSGRSRPWIAFNVGRQYDDLDEKKGDGRGNALLNPAYLYQLLPGVLTGSIKELGREDIDGAPATHYAANFDAEKAVKDAPRTRREAVLAALGLMNAKTDAIKGEVWIDDAGLPRKVLMHLRVTIARHQVISVNMDSILHKVGVDARVPIPSRTEAAGASDVGALSRGSAGLASRFANLGGAAFREGGGQPGGQGGGVPTPQPTPAGTEPPTRQATP